MKSTILRPNYTFFNDKYSMNITKNSWINLKPTSNSIFENKLNYLNQSLYNKRNYNLQKNKSSPDLNLPIKNTSLISSSSTAYMTLRSRNFFNLSKKEQSQVSWKINKIIDDLLKNNKKDKNQNKLKHSTYKVKKMQNLLNEKSYTAIFLGPSSSINNSYGKEAQTKIYGSDFIRDKAIEKIGVIMEKKKYTVLDPVNYDKSTFEKYRLPYMNFEKIQDFHYKDLQLNQWDREKRLRYLPVNFKLNKYTKSFDEKIQLRMASIYGIDKQIIEHKAKADAKKKFYLS